MKQTDPSRTPVHLTLRKAGKLYSRHRAFLFLLRSGLVLLALIPVIMIADVLFHFSDHLRFASGIVVFLAALVLLAVSAGIALFARPPLLRIARLLESRNPELGSKLVNILQLEEDANHAESDPLTRSLASRAVRDAGEKIDLPALPPLAREPRIKKSSAILAGTAVFLALLSLVGGPHVRSEWMRFLDPFGDHPPFSLTNLEIISPDGKQRVVYGSGFTVEVTATGHQPKELFLTAVSDEGKILIPMSARGDGTFLAHLENITSPLTLTAHTQDDSTRSHRRTLGLILTPNIGRTTVTLTPPEYTGLPSRELPYRFSALQALEGTQITFRIESNRPLGSGTLSLDTGNGTPSSFPLEPAADSPKIATANLTTTDSGRLTFDIIDIAGNSATENPAASLTVTRDMPPAIAVTIPDEDALVVDGLTVPITIDATDDYGLTSVRLHISINDEFIALDPITFTEEPTTRYRMEYPLDLGKIGALPGDKVAIFAEAIDSRPEPQITRTTMRRLDVITEEEYNRLLREEADVADIAGKYEDLLSRLEQRIEEQRRIEEQLKELMKQVAENPHDQEILDKFSTAFSEQYELNESLKDLADEMSDFGRDDPVYDFEKELQEKLAEQAKSIRESAEQNSEDSEKALEKGDVPPAIPSEEMIDAMEQAAREQRERLQGESDKAKEEVIQPLQDLANLHELMKDFNLFKELAEQQRELAEQTKAYADKKELNAEDRLALRDLGAKQRELAPKLEELSRKLKHDAEAAEEKFPEAAAEAKELAEAMDSANMPDLARRAAQSMLGNKPDDSHDQAKNLQEEMERLLGEQGEGGEQGQGLAQGLERALGGKNGMKPGDSFRQMMLSRRFRPFPGEGGSGMAQGGFMSRSAMDGKAQLLGGETFMDGPIARSLTGKGDGYEQGQSGAPTALLDPADPGAADLKSARRTGTPQSDTLLMEYENLADAYFRKLTTKP